MASENETVAEIVKELRDDANTVADDSHDGDCWTNLEAMEIYYSLADRFEAAHKREVAELRECLAKAYEDNVRLSEPNPTRRNPPMKNVQDTIRGVRDAATVARLLVYHFPLFANPPEKLDTDSLLGASVLILDALDALDAAFVEDRQLTQPHCDALRNDVNAIREIFDVDEGLVSDFANGKVSADGFAGAFHKAMTAVVKKSDVLSRDYLNAVADYNSRRLGV